MSYRTDAGPATCTYHRCEKSLPGKPERYGSPTPDPDFCSWGCWNGHETRKVLHAVDRAWALRKRT